MYFSIKLSILSFIYNIGIRLLQLGLTILAPFNHKIKLGVVGRSQTYDKLETQILKSDKCIWFHCASLGEYEQGLPVFKEVRKEFNTHKIVLTFFSPSGYQIRKDTPIADVVCYLPLDTKNHAKRFFDIVKPELTLFVKYDIWPNFLNELKERNHRAILISALFRPNQIYFKPFGRYMRSKLFGFEHIFTQDEASKNLLNKINYIQTTVSGDTRFDRVFSQLDQDNTVDFIENFNNHSICVVAGSTWPEDERILATYINEAPPNQKFIVAPHNIKPNQIQKFRQQLKKKSTLFSEQNHQDLKNSVVLIVDTIGILSKIYSYADIAYVGGALGTTGLHNTLEPAVFGVPIIIGNNYNKFPEAKIMIEQGSMFSIKNSNELQLIMSKLTSNKEFLKASGEKNANFIKKNTGAVIQIMNYIRI